MRISRAIGRRFVQYDGYAAKIDKSAVSSRCSPQRGLRCSVFEKMYERFDDIFGCAPRVAESRGEVLHSNNSGLRRARNSRHGRARRDRKSAATSNSRNYVAFEGNIANSRSTKRACPPAFAKLPGAFTAPYHVYHADVADATHSLSLDSSRVERLGERLVLERFDSTSSSRCRIPRESPAILHTAANVKRSGKNEYPGGVRGVGEGFDPSLNLASRGSNC